MSKNIVHFVDVDDISLNKEIDNLWDIHKYQTILAFKNTKSFSDFVKMSNNIAEVQYILNPKSIGKGYFIYYRQYKTIIDIRQLKKDFCEYYMPDYVKCSIDEYFKKDYFFIYYSQQSTCYDPMKAVIDALSDHISYDFVDEIEIDDIFWISH